MPRLSPRTLTACGVLTVTLSVVGLAGLQYLMPPSFNNRPAVNHAGIAHFQSVVSTLHSVPLSVSAFVWAFRCLIVGAWLGYGVLLFSCHRYGAGLGRATLPVIGSIVLLLAVVFPPSLSSDVYAYAGWGRMSILHGWSPYTHTLQSLGALEDPAGMVAPVAATSSHGPIWIALVSAVIMVLRNAGLWAQIVALKLLAGLALLLAALSAREIASFYDRKKAELALLAVAFNPVLLIEGPGNGHNDVLMVALMLGGIALCQKRRPGIGYALLGLSAGIKFVTASIVPWVILEQVRRQPPRERFTTVALALALVLAPSVLGYATFRAELRGFDGIRTVFERQSGS